MDFLKNLAKLIDVKTIVTFVVMAVFSVLALRGQIDVAQVMSVVIMIITFFFAKKEKEDDKK